MNFHPILFSTEMVQAILDGRKTMTRRIFKDHPRLCSDVFKIDLKAWFRDYTDLILSYSPYGSPSDILWVREKFRFEEAFEYDGEVYPESYWYYASTPEIFECVDGEKQNKNDYKWKPGIHMPKNACRIFLKITDIKVERLQDISETDATKEGVRYCPKATVGPNLQPGYQKYRKGWHKDIGSVCTAKISFKLLWSMINGNESWNKNPWVWVISFERIDKPENFE